MMTAPAPTASAAADRARRAGGDDDSAAQVRIGRADDVAADRGPRRARPRRDAVRDRRLDDERASCTRSSPHGYWHDEHMWPWELYEMLNLAAAVERAREFDIIHYEAAYYPMSLAFTRLSPTPIVQTLHHSPSEAEVALWSPLSRGAVRRDLERAGAPARRASTSSARSCTASTPTGSRSARRRTTTCCSSAASPRARACCRRSRWPGAPACG